MGIAYSIRDFDRLKVSKLFVVGIVRVHTMERMNHMFVRKTGEQIEENGLGGGFKCFLLSPLLGEMIQFDEHILQLGWLKPPTSGFSPLQGEISISGFDKVTTPFHIGFPWEWYTWLWICMVYLPT